MVDIKELMVGDFVILGKKKIRVHNICGHTNDVCLENGVLTNVMNLEPIPLTKGILWQMGFGYVESDGVLNHYYLGSPQICENMNLHIGNQGESYWVNDCRNILYGIKYVHQLQNAFKMFGYKIKIKL